ncbi:MAG TPA: exodeoxyribonuclease VII small subunit [Firmicutes bacterium]|nr:exodeoxyribonuclease VII small subunit [Bacillota bacterium]
MAVKKTSQEMTFAQMEARIKEIINTLSNSDIGLDEQVKLGEEGSAILDQMSKKLDELEKKANSIIKTDSAEK